MIVGTGLLARHLARLAPLSRATVVGVVSRDPELQGRPAADAVGSSAEGQVGQLPDQLDRNDVDVFLHAGPGGEPMWRFLESCAGAGHDAVTSSGLIAPWADTATAERAARLDVTARERGSRLLGTGMFPGFLADALPVTLASTMPGPHRIEVTQVSDISSWSPSVLVDEIGVGRPVDQPGLVLAAYIETSAHALAAGLGEEITSLRTWSTPVVATQDKVVGTVVVRCGTTVGFRFEVEAQTTNCGELRVTWQSRPEGQVTGTSYRLLGGDGTELVASLGQVDGYPATASRLLWAARTMSTQPAGILSVASVPVGHADLRRTGPHR